MNPYKTLSCSVTGYRKKMEGFPTEDATKVVHTKKGAVVAVADGHGDRRCIYAFVGSRLAVKAACHVLKTYLKSEGGDPSEYWNSHRREIAIALYKAYAKSVIEDYASRCKDRITKEEASQLLLHVEGYLKGQGRRLTPEEIREKYLAEKRLEDRLGGILFLYGTTLRASVLTDSYLFNCALGDGDTVALIEDRIEWLLPKADLYACETASMCESLDSVLDSFLFSFVAYSDVTAVMLSTDGFRNSFFSPYLFEKKVAEIIQWVKRNKRGVKTSRLKEAYERLSRESVFQDDISTVIAVRTENE